MNRTTVVTAWAALVVALPIATAWLIGDFSESPMPTTASSNR